MRVVLTFFANIDDVALQSADDKCSLRSAAQHLNTDYRNAVIIDGYKYTSEIAEPGKWTPGNLRVRDLSPEGKTTYYKNVTEALRKWR